MWTDRELQVMSFALDLLGEQILLTEGWTPSFEATHINLSLRFSEETRRRESK